MTTENYPPAAVSPLERLARNVIDQQDSSQQEKVHGFPLFLSAPVCHSKDGHHSIIAIKFKCRPRDGWRPV